MSEDTENRLRERRIMLIIWSLVWLAIMALGYGFAGGIRVSYPASIGEWASWLIVVSPLVPLALWLHARRQVRD